MELTVIAASVIGGAKLAGGTGVRTMVGAALIEMIRNSLTRPEVSTFWHESLIAGSSS